MGYGKCKCKDYRSCRCQTDYGNKRVTGIEYYPRGGCNCGRPDCPYAMNVIPRGVIPVEGMNGNFRGNAKPLANAEHGGLGWFGQYIYTKPIPAESAAGVVGPNSPASLRTGFGEWKTFGHVVPPFGLQPVKYPIQGKVILPGRLYKYRVLVGNQFYNVLQIYKLINGDVIDILGFNTPVVRWRVETKNDFWDHKIIEKEVRAYRKKK